MMRCVQVLGLLFIMGLAPAASLVSVQKMEAPPLMPLKKLAIVEPGSLCRLRGGADAGVWTKSEIVIAAYLGLSALPIGIMQVQDPAAAPWSKFAVGTTFKLPCSARTGMLLKYLPAVVFTAHCLTEQGIQPLAIVMLAQFAKRTLEVLLLHDFSGSPTEEMPVCIIIGAFYAMVAWLFSRESVRASPQVAATGTGLAIIGMLGNFYHHLLLKHLRTQPTNKDSVVSTSTLKNYHIPRGGLFELVSCPHYFFELCVWGGAALMTQALHTTLVLFWMTCMLTGRSIATTAWYRAKFGAKYPVDRKHIIPYLF